MRNKLGRQTVKVTLIVPVYSRTGGAVRMTISVDSITFMHT